MRNKKLKRREIINDRKRKGKSYEGKCIERERMGEKYE